jgi:hypothetical protein
MPGEHLSWSIVVYEFRVSCLIQGAWLHEHGLMGELCAVNTHKHTHSQGKSSARMSLKKERKRLVCDGEKGGKGKKKEGKGKRRGREIRWCL